KAIKENKKDNIYKSDAGEDMTKGEKISTSNAFELLADEDKEKDSIGEIEKEEGKLVLIVSKSNLEGKIENMVEPLAIEEGGRDTWQHKKQRNHQGYVMENSQLGQASSSFQVKYKERRIRFIHSTMDYR
ncbi:hypothetical protein HAX54_039438, partial [Datura stramonium]|nr:hypothetical protein [Datura stramonium]